MGFYLDTLIMQLCYSADQLTHFQCYIIFSKLAFNSQKTLLTRTTLALFLFYCLLFKNRIAGIKIILLPLLLLLLLGSKTN